MINILSIKCALAFAPYLAESAGQYLAEGMTASRVVRQGGTGLIIRSDAGVLLRHQNREVRLGQQEARHYLATVRFRIAAYEIQRMQDEIVMASFGPNLVMSFPQSEIWLEAGDISEMLRQYRESNGGSESSAVNLPDWLKVSISSERLLISDQRTGRWVLLGRDHVAELRRRFDLLDKANEPGRRLAPPVISLKGIDVHLQSAFNLAETLERFADAGDIIEFEDISTQFSLIVRKSTEGVELRDTERRVALTKREARKWAEIMRAELERLNASRVDRGQVRTVFADGDGGRWVLQWGDEVMVPGELLDAVRTSRSALRDVRTIHLRINRSGEFLLLLSLQSGACAALTQAELTSF